MVLKIAFFMAQADSWTMNTNGMTAMLQFCVSKEHEILSKEMML